MVWLFFFAASTHLLLRCVPCQCVNDAISKRVMFHWTPQVNRPNTEPGFLQVKSSLWYINIDPGSCRGWKTSFHCKLVIFRVNKLIFQRVNHKPPLEEFGLPKDIIHVWPNWGLLGLPRSPYYINWGMDLPPISWFLCEMIPFFVVAQWLMKSNSRWFNVDKNMIHNNNCIRTIITMINSESMIFWSWFIGYWYAGWLFGTCFIFHFIYGMSSFPLTFTPSYFSRWFLHHQPLWDIYIYMPPW